MRHFCVLFAALLCLSFQNPLRTDVLIETPVFTVHYSEVLEQPLSVEYNVQCTEKKFSRAGMDFYECDSVHTSDNADYFNNVWDKGHMAPAADFSCEQALLWGTFSYLNCALQHEKLNRGVWRLLENRERQLAQTGPVQVKIIVHFTEKSAKLPTGATIPDGFTKIITAGAKVERYYFPNQEPKLSSYTQYLQK